MKIYRQKKYTARKNHVCAVCGFLIEKGTNYWDFFGTFSFTNKLTIKVHDHCSLSVRDD